jgi:hypothetical protein
LGRAQKQGFATFMVVFCAQNEHVVYFLFLHFFVEKFKMGCAGENKFEEPVQRAYPFFVTTARGSIWRHGGNGEARMVFEKF